jgi:hypothetical protein
MTFIIYISYESVDRTLLQGKNRAKDIEIEFFGEQLRGWV